MVSRGQGCMLGQLDRDSLGGQVEFQLPERIRQYYPNGVLDMVDCGHWEQRWRRWSGGNFHVKAHGRGAATTNHEYASPPEARGVNLPGGDQREAPNPKSFWGWGSGGRDFLQEVPSPGKRIYMRALESWGFGR